MNAQRWWVVIETREGNKVVSECHPDGSFSWMVNPQDFKDRRARSAVISSTNCPKKVCNLTDVKEHTSQLALLDLFQSVGKHTVPSSARQLYAEKLYMFASGEDLEEKEPQDAQGEITLAKSHDDSRSIDFDLSCFRSFDPSAVRVEVVEPVDSMYKQFGGRCMLLRNVITPSECAYLIEQMDKDMSQVRYRQDYRRNDRCVFESAEFAEILWTRVEPFAAGLSLVVDEDKSKQRLLSEQPGDCPHDLRPGPGKEGVWHPAGLNECLRFCKYSPGGFFRKHCDACYERSEDEQSFFTCMFYLNGNFEGGATRFLHLNSGSACSIESQYKLADDDEVLASVTPESGLCMLFFQPGLLHEGGDLRAGLKYILRTDVMYRRDPTTKKQRTPQQAEAMSLLKKAEAAEMRREFDLSCSLYRRAFKLDPELEQSLR